MKEIKNNFATVCKFTMEEGLVVTKWCENTGTIKTFVEDNEEETTTIKKPSNLQDSITLKAIEWAIETNQTIRKRLKDDVWELKLTNEIWVDLVGHHKWPIDQQKESK